MMTWLRRLSVRLGLWLAEWGGWLPPPEITPEIKAYTRAAQYFVQDIQDRARTDAGGEYKRHVVYSQLQKTLPKARKRDLALAIELAVQTLAPNVE